MFEALVERVTKTVTRVYGQEIEAARPVYFLRCGEPFQDEPSYELRLRNFLEWYLFDRPLAVGLTPHEAFMADAEQPAEERAAFLPFRDQVHSLFRVERILPEGIDVLDLWTRQIYAVKLEVTLGYDPGAVIETRLVPFQNAFYATQTHVYHPTASARYIERRAGILRKQRRVEAWYPFLQRTNYLQLKAERYKHVESNKIYKEILSEESAVQKNAATRAA